MTPIVPPGGFFILADTSHIPDPPTEYMRPTLASPDPMPRDWALCRWLTIEVGVTAIPPSAFYSPGNMGLAKHYLRFAFCKSDDTIRAAQSKFEQYFGRKA
jgi:aspartate/methionine/tyrosine aminotransferase